MKIKQRQHTDGKMKEKSLSCVTFCHPMWLQGMIISLKFQRMKQYEMQSVIFLFNKYKF
jgi:hypothetical protein